MQKPLSPVNFISATPAPAARGKTAAPDNDGAQFTQALKREVAQRQEQAPAKTVKQATAADAPKQAAVKAEKAAAARHAAAPAEQARKAHVKEKQADADAAAATAAAAETGAVNPMVDMLALVASLQMRGEQPQQAAAAVADKAPAAAVSGLESQLGALPTAAAALPGEADAAQQGTPDGKFLAMMRSASTDDAGDAMQKQDLFSKTPLVDSAPEPVISVTRPGADIAQLVRRDDTARMMPAETAVSAPLTNAVQQASLSVAQAVNAAAGDKIPARVGTPGWDNQVAQKIVYMVGGGDMSASLTLNPPDLGPMQVVLNVSNDHADVTFTSAQPEVRQALEDALPRLREMMSESGIALGNASVNDGAQQQAQEQAAGARGPRGRMADGSGTEAEADAVNGARAQRTAELPGLVNTFA